MEDEYPSDYCSTCGLVEKHCCCCFEAQSGAMSDVNIQQAPSDLTQQNVSFADQADPYIYDVISNSDSTRKMQDSDVATLDNFFKRPIKIHEFEWATSTALVDDIDPWSLYFDNPRVSNRLSNYNLLRANLHVKIVINGNGFQYGRGLVSYLPFDVFDTLSSNAALVPEDLVQASQQPHVFLDPTTSTGGELRLPFFNDYNCAHIPTSQWSQFGRLYFRTLNTMKHANGATDVVTVSVFAWAEDVNFNVLTTNDQDTMTPQMGTETEEANNKGFISGPATSIARMSGALMDIPIIAPYATATNTLAKAAASAAKTFGYCKPAVTKAPEPYRPTPTSTLAMTNTPDTTQKLTIDDQQELSIDPRIAGLGSVDPLNIKTIASRESYLTTFTWPVGTAPETLLWNGRVDPVTWAYNVGPPASFHFPACAVAALPFKYWTGTMKFRFQIVASSFHKGRIKVVYDPNYIATGSLGEYNINALKIVDIAEEQDFTVEIGNGQDKTLLGHHLPGIDSVTQMYSTTQYISREEGNGVVAVSVVNELTVPNSTVNNDIEVNVFVSMGDDFEVFVPDDHFQSFVFKPQSGFEEEFEAQSGIVTEEQNTTEPSKPLQELSSDLGPAMQDCDKISTVFTGESIQSFRTLLKRYNLHTTIGSGNSSLSDVQGTRPTFPYLRGNVAGAVNSTGLLTNYSYCNTLLMHWITYAFSGWRGSIRYKFLTRGNWSDRLTMYVGRGTKSGAAYAQNRLALPNYFSTNFAAHSSVKDSGTGEIALLGPKGIAYTHAKINPSMEFEIPWYSDLRFAPGKREDLTTSTIFTENWEFRINGMIDKNHVVDVYAAVGEDFQCYFFTGLPRMYYEASPPTP